MKRRKPYLYTHDPDTGKRVLAHRWLAEQALGRPLRPEEVVHHRDGDSLNNDLDNLIVLPHQRFHAHAEFHSRRQRKGMPSLFPEHFQGIPESRGSLFDRVFVLVLHEPPGAPRYRTLQGEVAEIDAEPLFPVVMDTGFSRHFTLSIPDNEPGAKTLADLLGQLKVEVTAGETRDQTLLRDFFPDQAADSALSGQPATYLSTRLT